MEPHNISSVVGTKFSTLRKRGGGKEGHKKGSKSGKELTAVKVGERWVGTEGSPLLKNDHIFTTIILIG